MKKSLFIFLIMLGVFLSMKGYTQNTETISSEDIIYTRVDKMPEFPGGQVALVKFLSKNIKYPSKYKKDKVNGRVFVSFVIDKTGKVTQSKITKSLNDECDREALRVINMMPNWIPGEKDGKKVDVQFGLPVNFE